MFHTFFYSRDGNLYPLGIHTFCVPYIALALASLIPSEYLTTQHRLLVMDVEIRKAVWSKRTFGVYRVKWWNLNEKNRTELCEKIKTEGKWRLEGDSNRIWEEMAGCIQRLAREVLGVSRGGSGRMEGA